MKLSIIAALGRNRAIGYQNQLPWRLPADLQRFKQLTMGHHMLMGRKTFESIGRPLPGRTSLIITRQPNYKAEGCLIVHSLEDAIALAQARGEQEAFVIGGADIYAQTLLLADRMYLTWVEAEPEADAFFPTFEESAWETREEAVFAADEKHQYAMRFQTFNRSLKG